MGRKLNTFKPDWITPPGATISDLLEEYQWSRAEFASRMDYSRKHVNQLLHGKASVNEDTAIRLERVLGSTVAFWMSREARYREALAREDDLFFLKNDIGWLKKLPIKDMIAFGWIQQFTDKRELVAECLKFFGVASVDRWEAKYELPIAAFRSSKLLEKQKGGAAAWLREGERRANQILCDNYDRVRFLHVFEEIRSLTNKKEENIFIPKLREICASVGVAVAIVPTPKDCPISGATRWLDSERALLILSNRYKTNDQFWFSFFHEAGHLLLHGKRLMFIDVEGQLDSKQEEEANIFARNALIPERFISRLRTLSKNERAIKAFAHEVGVAPGIIVGRMQKEGLLSWAHLNRLKTKISLN